LDRYTQKDLTRAFVPEDLAIVTLNPGERWPRKEVGTVLSVDGDHLTLRWETGPDAGTNATLPAQQADRPVETTLEQIAQRIGTGIAAVESTAKGRKAWSQRFAAAIQNWRWIPGGRVWAGAGTEQAVTYFNCYCLPSPRDSREGIIETLGQMVEIMSRGGGVGFTVSSLRPRHAPVLGVNGRSSGAVSWMDLYSRATGLVEQGGSRKGALMLQLDDWHPDLLEFIKAKQKPGMIENANMSVRISNAFMQAVREDLEWDLVFPDTTDPTYDETWTGDLTAWRAAGKPVNLYARHPARTIWDAIVTSAWASAEPGLVFADRMEHDSNSQLFAPLISTNP
jgi:ribonucleoside-diphosphate reductase alpha chain